MTKERLRNYGRLKQECKQLEAQIEMILGDMASVSSPRLTGMPRSNNRKSLDEIIVRYEEATACYERQLKRCIAERIAIEKAIESVRDARLRLILRYRYQDGESWENIASYLGYNKRWVLRLHGQALAEISKINP